MSKRDQPTGRRLIDFQSVSLLPDTPAHVEAEELFAVVGRSGEWYGEVEGDWQWAEGRDDDPQTHPDGNAVVLDGEVPFDGSVIDEAGEVQFVVRQDRNLVLQVVEEAERTADVELVFVWPHATEAEATEAANAPGINPLEHRSVPAHHGYLGSRRKNVFATTVLALPDGEELAGFERADWKLIIAQHLFHTNIYDAAAGWHQVTVTSVSG